MGSTDSKLYHSPKSLPFHGSPPSIESFARNVGGKSSPANNKRSKCVVFVSGDDTLTDRALQTRGVSAELAGKVADLVSQLVKLADHVCHSAIAMLPRVYFEAKFAAIGVLVAGAREIRRSSVLQVF